MALSAVVDSAARADGASARRVVSPGRVLAVAALGTFMAFVDATIVNIAIPSIHRQFPSSGLSSVSWVLNAYNIVFAAFLVGGGQLADLLGRRRVFSASLILFTLASAACAAAPSLGALVAARVVQAIGAAGLVPSSLAIVLQSSDENRRTHSVSLWAATAALAAGVGPALGGVLITASSWRLVFLVNIPVGLVAWLLAGRVLIESRAPGRRRVPDLVGGAALALTTGALVLGIVKGPEWGWSSLRVIASFALAVASGVYFVMRSSRQRTPVVDLSLMRIRSFALSNAVTIVMAAGFYAYTLCNVLFLTGVWRYSILEAGLSLTPGPLIAIAVAAPASMAVERFGHRAVVVPGALIWAAGTLFFASTLGVSPDFLGGWLPGMAILGVGAGLSFPTLSGAAVSSVPGTRFAVATSLNSVARQVGAALGVAVLIAIVGTQSAPHLPAAAAPAIAAALEHAALESARHTLLHGWLFAGGCFVAGAAACLALRVAVSSQDGEAAAAAAIIPLGPAEMDDLQAVMSLPTLVESVGLHADSTPQTVVQILRKSPIFAAIPAPMLEHVAGLATEVSLPRGEFLFREGDPGDAVYLVRVGHLEARREHSDERGVRVEEVANTMTRGAAIGELAVLSGSTRSASVRALRDSELLRIDGAHFMALLRAEPDLAVSLTRVLSTQLQASRSVAPAKRPRPVTIALRTADEAVPLLDIADELSRALCVHGRVAVVYPEDEHGRDQSRAQAAARFGELIERCEADHDHVLMLCSAGPAGSGWDEFCISRADRVIAVVDGTRPRPGGELDDWLETLRGADLLAYGTQPGSGSMERPIELLRPAAVYSVSAGDERRADMARTARRLSGRAVGLVLSGGGGRAFSHLGVLEVLLDAGVTIDRVGGVSMGAFIGGLLAAGHDSASMDAICFEEWVRRNPVNDYTFPRASLIKGEKAQAMLERVFGEVRVEELARSYYCASTDLRSSELVIHRDGPMWEMVGASMSLPLIAPPHRRERELLIDGSLLDNLPLAPMSSTGEGPVIAVDVKGGEERTDAMGHPERREGAARRLPSLPETMGRIALLSSANTDGAAQRYADLSIEVRVSGVGLLEFHQIDQSRAAGRAAALSILQDPPDWVLGGQVPADLSGRRTVIRV